MIFVARILHLIGAALAISCMFALVLLFGRRGNNPVIDAPEFIPVAFAFFIFGVGLVTVSATLGSDLPPFDKKRARKPAVTAGKSGVNPDDARMILDHMSGKARLSAEELGAAFGRTARDMEAAMTPQERARRDQIAKLKVDTAPVRLKVMVPPGPSDSWVGGNPSMPDGVAWPNVDGKPAVFYAQIAASQLPPGIWGGYGPRSGWLLIFGPPEHSHGGAVVMHTISLGRERKRPVGQVFRNYRFGDYDKHALLTMGDKGLQPPKWPVEIVPTDLRAQPAEIPESSLDRSFDLDEAGWQPFDWPSLQALMAETIAQTHYMINLSTEFGDDPFQLAQKESLEALLPPLEQLAELLRSRANKVAFTDMESERILQALRGMTYQLSVRQGGVRALKPQKLAARLSQSDYPALHDTRAKHVYTEDPNALPLYVRKLLELKWKAVAEAEVITMGGSAQNFEQTGAAVFLELTPSRLFSWTFGDYSNFAVMLQSGDLVDDRWDKAYGMDNHGI